MLVFKISCLSILFCLTQQAEILSILPYWGTSHYRVFEPLLDELARRGHQLTVASYFPKEKPFPNYTSVSLHDGEDLRGFIGFERFEAQRPSVYSNMRLIHDLNSQNEKIMTLPSLMNLQKRKFDLVIGEYFNTDLFFGLVYKIGAPYILVSTCEHFPWQSYGIGDSIGPSFVGHIFANHPRNMGVVDRLVNTLEVYLSIVGYEIFFRWNEQKIAEKHLGDLPPLREIANNASLYLVHTYFMIQGPKPLMPNSVQIGGIAIKQPNPLPQDLQKLMDQSEGVIYFSMGSVLKGDSLHDKKQQAFIKVFSELKQTVLWKRESPLSVNVKNIVTNGWYPQRDILAHPKVRLFITHCGLLGTNEAVSSGVPMVGIPMFGDQHHNAKALESIGVAVTLDFNELNENNIREAINKVLQNPSYKENAIKMKEAYLDRPMSPLDTAVYWVEYVIRHKGAPHLKSAARHLTWYQYHNLDVYALLLLLLYISYLAVKFIIKFLYALCCKKTKLKTQ